MMKLVLRKNKLLSTCFGQLFEVLHDEILPYFAKQLPRYSNGKLKKITEMK